MRAGSLVALHGFTGHPDAFSGLGLERLVERPFVPLALGHGPRPEVPSPTFSAEVERLADEISALPAPRRLLGYSQGARLGLGLLTHAPSLFERAALIGAQPGLTSLSERRVRRELEDGWIAELEAEGVSAFVDAWCKLPLFGPALDPRGLRQEQPFRWDHRKEGLIAALLVLGTSQMPNLWPRLDRVACPVELWPGALDEKFVHIAAAMAHHLPRASVVPVPGAHHNPITDSVAQVRVRLEAWLAA